MAFPVELTSVLTGASISQLKGWRSSGLLAPEVQSTPVVLYSFRDIIALRTFVRMRADISLQKIRKAVAALPEFDLTDHPSQYQLHTDGKSVYFSDDGRSIDLVEKKGQQLLVNLQDVFAPFENMQGSEVTDFRRPRPHLEVRESRLGGWPTVENTRVAFDTIGKLLTGGEVAPKDVSRFYPSVTASGAIDAKDLYDQVKSLRRRSA